MYHVARLKYIILNFATNELPEMDQLAAHIIMYLKNSEENKLNREKWSNFLNVAPFKTGFLCSTLVQTRGLKPIMSQAFYQ